MGTHAFGRRLPETRASADHPAVDLVHLSRQSMGDRALEGELLGLFTRQARSVLATLTAAVEEGQLPAWGCDPLHMLTGSARAVGCWTVADQAQDLELEIRAAALARTTVPAANRLVPLAAAVEAACSDIARLLDDPA